MGQTINIISQDIKKMNDEQLQSFVRKRLEYNGHQLDELRGLVFHNENPHRRFDMSGYGDGKGSCVRHNTDILNLFSDCGIYNQIQYLFLDAYKGSMTLYYKGWEQNKSLECDLAGGGTVEVIMQILKLTVINCSFPQRRRS